jgi:hypothetical protein
VNTTNRVSSATHRYEILLTVLFIGGTNHGSAGDRMFVEAFVDVGCGDFSWRVEAPPEPTPEPPRPTLESRVCRDAHKHSDVHPDWVDMWAPMGCNMDPARKTMKAGDKEIYWHPIGFYGGEWYQNYKISWIDGCTVATEQSIELPIEGDGLIKCGQLLKDNYYYCKLTALEYIQAVYEHPLIVLDQTGNNGGAGGWIDAGCLRYDFYITG